jgi:antitoxin component YwqK of YwqJK toxin-antitoxin module
MLVFKTLMGGVIALCLSVLYAYRPAENPVNGEIVRVNDKGDTVFQGFVKKNRLHGSWASWYPGRQRCDSGRLVNAVADGAWKVWYPSGQPRFECNFNASKLNAIKDEIRKQPKNRYYALSQVPPSEAALHFSAAYLFGHHVPQNKAVILSQKIQHQPYAPEALDRITALNATEGDKSYYPPFTEGLLHGTFTSWRPDGSLKETGLYLNGLREGIWEIYKEDQVKGVGTYRQGRPYGEWRYYSAEGRVLYWKRFDAKGQVSEEYHFKARP